jgi:hypothetical protein
MGLSKVHFKPNLHMPFWKRSLVLYKICSEKLLFLNVPKYRYVSRPKMTNRVSLTLYNSSYEATYKVSETRCKREGKTIEKSEKRFLNAIE